MYPIHADQAVSMSEFKKNPAAVLKNANRRPVAVLNHNKPAFYMVEPELFEALLEELSEHALHEKVQKRLAAKSRAVSVSLDEL